MFHNLYVNILYLVSVCFDLTPKTIIDSFVIVFKSILLFVYLLTLIGLSLKIKSISSAIIWVYKHGLRYKKLLKLDPRTYKDYYNLIEAAQGDFFPFGLKDYKWYDYTSKLEKKSKKKKRHEKVHLWFYTYSRLTPTFICITLLLVFVANKTNYLFIPANVFPVILLIGALILLSDSILMSVESIMFIWILKSYAKDFHWLHLKKSNSDKSFAILELIEFAKTFFLALLACSLVVFISELYFNAFEGYVIDTDFNLGYATGFYEALYFALTTMTTLGYGEIHPDNLYGITSSFFIQIQSILIFGVGISSIAALVGKESPNED